MVGACAKSIERNQDHYVSRLPMLGLMFSQQDHCKQIGIGMEAQRMAECFPRLLYNHNARSQCTISTQVFRAYSSNVLITFIIPLKKGRSMRGVTDKLIVLSSLKYGDTSLIVKAFTYQFGVLSFMLKGIRKRRGGVVALYQPASVLEANIVYREGKSLHGINQPKHVFVAHKTTAELQRMAKALFISEYLQNILIQESPNEELFYAVSRLAKCFGTR